jgi:hypothetical protein
MQTTPDAGQLSGTDRRRTIPTGSNEIASAARPEHAATLDFAGFGDIGFYGRGEIDNAN